MFGLLVSALTLVRVEGHLEHGFPVEFGHVTGHLLDHFFKESTLVGLQVRVELRSYPLLQTFLAWNGIRSHIERFVVEEAGLHVDHIRQVWTLMDVLSLLTG